MDLEWILKRPGGRRLGIHGNLDRQESRCLGGFLGRGELADCDLAGIWLVNRGDLVRELAPNSAGTDGMSVVCAKERSAMEVA